MVVKGASDIWVKLARCCTPVPGDAINGFVTRGNGVSVHRLDCDNMVSLTEQEPDRVRVPGRRHVSAAAVRARAGEPESLARAGDDGDFVGKI